jgi:hypothetical protein
LEKNSIVKRLELIEQTKWQKAERITAHLQ